MSNLRTSWPFKTTMPSSTALHMQSLRPPWASFVRLYVKKLKNGMVEPTTIPAKNTASCENRTSALQTFREPAYKPRVTSKYLRRSSLDSGYNSDGDTFPDILPRKFAKTATDSLSARKTAFTAPTYVQRQEAKEQIIRDMAEIMALESNAAGPKFIVSVFLSVFLLSSII